MEQKNLEKLRRLEQLAAEDPICRDYDRTIAELEQAFCRLLRLLPAKAAQKAESYVEYCRLRQQRLLWLACEHMDFIDKETE